MEQVWYRALVHYFVASETFNGAYAQLQQAGFGCSLRGRSNLWYRVERSPNLTNWGVLSTHPAGAVPLSLTDGEATNIIRRFYRTRLVPSP